MAVPIHKLSKEKLVWLATHKCKHRMPYIQHYNCYLNDHPDVERIGCLDIETSHLKANFGLIISYCILDIDGKGLKSGCITPKQIHNPKIMDKEVVSKLVKDLLTFDKVITYYGTGFDIPFIRTRALINGVDFPTYGTIKHIDAYYMVRNRFSMHSKRQDVACRTILGDSDKTYLRPDIWMRATHGADPEAIKYIFEHNVHDVHDLRRLYLKINDYAKTVNRSI